VKRQRRDEGASDGRVNDEDEEERMAEEKLRQLREWSEKLSAERPSGAQPSSSSPSSSSTKECLKSSWQQVGSLMLYTAAGVRGSEKV